MIPIN